MRVLFSGEPDAVWPDGEHSFGQQLPSTAGIALVEAGVNDAIRDAIPPNGTLLELGSWTCALSAWLAQQRPDARITAVDNFVGVNTGHVLRGMLTLTNLFLYDNLYFFKGPIREFGQLCRDRYWDVVFVDAGHTFIECASDLDVAVRLTRHSILVHDYGDVYPGVVQAVTQFCDREKWRIARQVCSLVFLERM